MKRLACETCGAGDPMGCVCLGMGAGLPEFSSGGVLARWVRQMGAESSAAIDETVPYRRGRREPLGAVVVTKGGRRWYFRAVESRQDVVARGLLQGLMTIGGVL